VQHHGIDTALTQSGGHCQNLVKGENKTHFQAQFGLIWTQEYGPGGVLTAHHASFLDFLSHPTRSGPFYTRDSERHTDLVRCVLKALANDETAVIPFEPFAW
jgi:hypothetical protein